MGSEHLAEVLSMLRSVLALLATLHLATSQDVFHAARQLAEVPGVVEEEDSAGNMTNTTALSPQTAIIPCSAVHTWSWYIRICSHFYDFDACIKDHRRQCRG